MKENMLRAGLMLMTAMLLLATAAFADETPTFTGPESVRERTFVAHVQADLKKRFPHPAEAIRAGFVRYTEVDETGAISYANREWNSADAQHPSQLWYDVRGNLLGADFSRPLNGPHLPHLWGVNPGRWITRPDHVHFVSRDPKSGKLRYGRGAMAPEFIAAGGNLRSPSAATFVRMHKVKKASDIITIFRFPAIYDLAVWVAPNPLGAFALTNPRISK